MTSLAPTNLFKTVAIIHEGAALPIEVLHEMRCEAGNALKAQRSGAGQHVELIVAAGFLLLEVVTEAARRDDVQPVVVKVFSDSTDGSWEMKNFTCRTLWDGVGDLQTQYSQDGPMTKCEQSLVYASITEIVDTATSHLSSYRIHEILTRSGRIWSRRILFSAISITGETLKHFPYQFERNFSIIIHVSEAIWYSKNK